MHEASDDELDDAKLGYLPRLADNAYRGRAKVHWTLPIAHRRTGWLTPEFHLRFRELLLHAQERDALACPIYCLMPDHMHLIWMGCAESSDQLRAMRFLRTHAEPLLGDGLSFQHQAHDHVLRPEERESDAFQNACHYIAMNPVRAALVSTSDQWPYTGCAVLGYPRLNPLQRDYWPLLWRIYFKLTAKA